VTLTEKLHNGRKEVTMSDPTERAIDEVIEYLNEEGQSGKATDVHKLWLEREKVREALRLIITHQSLLTELADQTGGRATNMVVHWKDWASVIAREALKEVDDEQT
jgi:hypothetical protein